MHYSLTKPQPEYLWKCYEHIGSQLQNERTTENWAYGRFYAKLGIYQYGRER